MSEVKWLWFFIMIGALVVVAHHIAVLFKASAEAKGGEIAQLYNKVFVPASFSYIFAAIMSPTAALQA